MLTHQPTSRKVYKFRLARYSNAIYIQIGLVPIYQMLAAKYHSLLACKKNGLRGYVCINPIYKVIVSTFGLRFLQYLCAPEQRS